MSSGFGGAALRLQRAAERQQKWPAVVPQIQRFLKSLAGTPTHICSRSPEAAWHRIYAKSSRRLGDPEALCKAQMPPMVAIEGGRQLKCPLGWEQACRD